MSMPLVPPFAVTASYQKTQYAQGTYTQGGSQVFSALVSPPTSGVSAEAASTTAAVAKGFSAYSARNEVQTVSVLGSPTGGTFKLQWGEDVTGTIAYNATAGAVQTALRGLGNVPAPTGGVNDVQTVSLTGAPTGGTFTLTYAGQTTAGIAFNANAAAVLSALVALSNIDPGDVTVTGTGPWVVTFGGTKAYASQTVMTGSGASLTGGTSPAVSVAHTTTGVAQNQNLTVTGSDGGPFTVTFLNALTNTNVAQLAADDGGLTGGTNARVEIDTTAGGRLAFVNQALQDAHRQQDRMRDFYDSSGGNHF